MVGSALVSNDTSRALVCYPLLQKKGQIKVEASCFWNEKLHLEEPVIAG